MQIILSFFILFVLDISLYSSTLIFISERSDYLAGHSVAIDPDSHFGRIAIPNQLGVLADAFDIAPKSAWQISALSPIYSCLNAEAHVVGASGAELVTAFAASPERFTVEFFARVSSAHRGGGVFLEDETGTKVFLSTVLHSPTGELLFGTRSSFVSIGPLWPEYKMKLIKTNAKVEGYYFNPSAGTWTYMGQKSLAGSLVRIGIGNVNAFSLDVYIRDLKISPYESSGIWTSAVQDLTRTPTTVGKIEWDQDLPGGTRIDIQTSTSPNGTAWSPWSAAYTDPTGSTISSPNARYIRVSATLYSDAANAATPVLDAIRIRYPDSAPSVPVLTPKSHPTARWSTPSALTLDWAMPAGNPAPESAYTYWLKRGGVLTATAQAPVSEAAGAPHPFVLPLPEEGSYSLDFQVLGDSHSGGLTQAAQTYSFGYDATPPGQTSIESPTHPQLLFVNNRNPVFRLRAGDAMSGISGWAAVLDKVANSDPGGTVNAGDELRYSELDNGTWYLHAAAIDLAGNKGPVSHYGIRVDYSGQLLSKDYVKALPNPVRSDTAELYYELAAPATELKLEFRNSQGEVLKSEDGPRQVGANRVRWDLSGLANGVYFFRVSARSAEDGKRYGVTRKVAVLR